MLKVKSFRLFIAVPLPKEIFPAVKKSIHQLSDQSTDKLPGKIVSEDKWHFTIEFLGNIPETKLETLFKVFNAVPLPKAFTITLSKIGAFPNTHSARILWLGILESSKELEQISDAFKTALQNADFMVDQRPFIPHITIRRLHKPQNVSRWVEKQVFHKIKAELKEVLLIQSFLEKEESHYKVLCSRKL